MSSWHAPAQRPGVIGAHHRRDSNRAVPGTCRTPDGSCVWSAWADGTARWVLPPSTSCGSITEWVLNQACSCVLPMAESLQESAPAPVAEIARLQVVSAAPHAYPPAGAYVWLALTLRGIRSGTLFLSPETLRSCIARNSRQTIQKIPRSARGDGRCERCSTIDLSKRPPVFSSLTQSERRASHCDGVPANARTQAPT